MDHRRRLIHQAVRERVIGAGSSRSAGELNVAPEDLPLALGLTVYPAWLFDQDGKLIPTARSVNAELAKLGNLSWAAASWWTRQNRQLGSLSPRELLPDSDRSEVHEALMQAAVAHISLGSEVAW